MGPASNKAGKNPAIRTGYAVRSRDDAIRRGCRQTGFAAAQIAPNDGMQPTRALQKSKEAVPSPTMTKPKNLLGSWNYREKALDSWFDSRQHDPSKCLRSRRSHSVAPVLENSGSPPSEVFRAARGSTLTCPEQGTREA